MNEWKLRILHISDLHERGSRESELFRRRRVLGDAWERNLDELLEDGPATDFIEALLTRLSLPRWMAGGRAPLGLEGVPREELLSRQGAFRDVQCLPTFSRGKPKEYLRHERFDFIVR